MKHQLTNPAFPDLVEVWAAEERIEITARSIICVNDNDEEENDLSDPFLELLARVDIAETRCW